MDPLMSPMQALALSDAFGSMRALGRGEQFQGRALPLMMQQAAQRQQQDAENAKSDAYLKAMGFPPQGGQQSTPDMMPGNPLGGQQAMPELAGGQYNPAAQQMPLGQPLQTQQPQGGLGAMPPMIRQQVQALVASGDRAGAASLLREYSIKAATASPQNPYDRYKVVPGVGLVDLAAGDKPGVAIPAREGRPQADPSSVQEYRYAVENGFGGNYTDFLDFKKGNGVTYTGPDGATVQVGGSGNQKNPKLTEAESKGLLYYDRANAAEATLNEFEGELTSLTQRGAANVPVIGNFLVSPEYQRAQQAGREFLASILRKDTGAAVTDGEVALYTPMFLPEPGDAPEVLAQKKEARRIAVDAIKKTLGAGAEVANPRTGGAPDLSTKSLEELQALRKQLAGQ